MESENSNQEVFSIKKISNPKCHALAEKCISHLRTLNIDQKEYELYINDDALMRFLVAREYDENKSFNMWSQWADWRLQYQPDKILPKHIKNELKTGKAYLHGYDREGRPCMIVKNCLHIPENSDIDELVAIVDRKNTGYRNLDKRLLGKMNLISMMQDYYAERMHKVYIMHVNWIFKMVHTLVKPFLSEKTISKMKIINHQDELKEFFTDENLLKEHGGTSEYIYNYEDSE